MRYSFESRCRLIALVRAGASPPAAAGACGASRATGYRLWRRFQEGGWAALLERPPVPGRQPRRLERGRGGDPRGACLRARGTGDRRRPARPPSLDGVEAAAPSRALSTAAASARAGRALRARAARRARPHRHQAPRPLLDDRQGDPRRAAASLPARRLAVPAPCDRRPQPPRLRGAAAQREPSRLRRLPPARRRLLCRAGQHRRTVLTDNGNGYRSQAWAAACEKLEVARRSTRPRRAQTNGKAEALVKTLQREWAYRFASPTSVHRAKALSGYLRWYSRHRPHGSLGGKPPISRVSQVCGSHS